MNILSAREFCGGYRFKSRSRHKGTFTHSVQDQSAAHASIGGLFHISEVWWSRAHSIDTSFSKYLILRFAAAEIKKRVVLRNAGEFDSSQVCCPSQFGSIASLLSAPCSRTIPQACQDHCFCSLAVSRTERTIMKEKHDKEDLDQTRHESGPRGNRSWDLFLKTIVFQLLTVKNFKVNGFEKKNANLPMLKAIFWRALFPMSLPSTRSKIIDSRDGPL